MGTSHFICQVSILFVRSLEVARQMHSQHVFDSHSLAHQNLFRIIGPAEVAAWGILGEVWDTFEYITGKW